MEETQSLRLIGNMDILEVLVDNVAGQNVIYWEDIKQVFPGVKHVQKGKVVIPMSKDLDGNRILPHRIKHHPGVVLDVVLSTTVEPGYDDPPIAASPASGEVDTTTGTTIAKRPDDAPPAYAPADTLTNAPPAHSPTDHPIEDNMVETLQITSPLVEKPFSNVSASGLSSTFSLSLSRASASVKVAPKTELFQRIVKKAQVLQVEQRFISSLDPDIQERIRASSNAYNLSVEALNDGRVEESERLERDFSGHFQELKAVAAKNTDPAAQTVVELLSTMITKQEEMKQLQIDARKALEAKQDELNANQNKMKQLQIDARKTLETKQDELNAKQEEIKHLQIDARNVLEAKQNELNAKQDEIKELQIQALGQLAVLHTRIKAVLTQTVESTQGRSTAKAKVHHIHIAKHEGYEITRPTEFFQRYGPYVLTILKILKFSISVAGVAVPAISQLVRADFIDQASTHLQKLQADIEPGMDKVIALMDGASVDEGATIERFEEDMENKMALEGADLRKLDTFLKDKDGNKVLGNMFRTVTDEGHAKWVCIDHYRENYQESTAKEFQRVLDSLGGTVDEHLGRVDVKLQSRALADNFWAVLGKTRSIHELDVDLDWACNMSDLDALQDALAKSSVSILRLDIKQFQLSLGNTPSYASAEVALHRIMELPDMKVIHIILPTEFAKLSRLQSTHLRKLFFEMVVGKRSGKEYRILAEKLKVSATTTNWYLYYNLAADNGAQVLSEALKTKSTRTTWVLQSNSVGSDGVKALTEALKTNSTLTTLDLPENNIGDDGAKALAEALKTNSTLITLNVGSNSIGSDGVKALAEALKTNSMLTTLDLPENNIGDDGAKALTEALKTNSTLITLNVGSNSIGSDGAKALTEAFKTNSTLTTLDLRGNNIPIASRTAAAAVVQTMVERIQSNRIASITLDDLSPKQRQAVKEQVNQMMPMYLKLDPLMPVFYALTNNRDATIRLILMKFMFQDQLNALKLEQYTITPENLSKLKERLQHYFMWVKTEMATMGSRLQR
ncbi:mediator complex subunit [Mortierella antarctica]|nr:mediator complex subunit [Mortierella antarctica]